MRKRSFTFSKATGKDILYFTCIFQLLEELIQFKNITDLFALPLSCQNTILKVIRALGQTTLPCLTVHKNQNHFGSLEGFSSRLAPLSSQKDTI